jgi:DNA invertase Pin-like site-specific DNA recombinase
MTAALREPLPARLVAVYVRISDDREGAGLGVDRQEKDCRAIAARMGWHVVDVYVDNDLTAYGKSKKAKPRPGYDRLKADIGTGRVQGVVTWHTDRLHRTPRELEDFIDLAETHSLPVETAKSGVVDLGTPGGRAVARTLCAWAFYESEHKSDRVKAKYVQLAEAGLPGNGGCRPFGYTADRLHVVETEAAHLRWAYAQVLAGRSLRSVALDLTEKRGVTSTQGKPWTVQALRLNLLSPRNVGLREHRGLVVGDAVWQPVVDRQSWEKVRAILTTPGRMPNRKDGTVPTSARRHLLVGLLWCGRCGGRLAARSSRDNQRYGCRARRDGGCGGSSMYIAYADQAIVDLVLDKLEATAELDAQAPADPTQQLLNQIAADEQRLEELARAFADDIDQSPLELRAAGARIRGRIEQARTQIAHAIVAQRVANPLEVRAAWPVYDLQQQRQVILTLIERIDVGPGTPGVWDPERMTVTWR